MDTPLIESYFDSKNPGDYRGNHAHVGRRRLSPWGDDPYVDDSVYPMVRALWDAGIRTAFSCGGGPVDRAAAGYDYHCDRGETEMASGYITVVDPGMRLLLELGISAEIAEVKFWRNGDRDSLELTRDPRYRLRMKAGWGAGSAGHGVHLSSFYFAPEDRELITELLRDALAAMA